VKTVWNILKIVFTVGLIWFVFRKTDFRSIGTALGSINPGWYLGALGLALLQQLFSIMRWRRLLEWNGIHLTWGRTMRFHFMSLLFQAFLPSGFGGDAAKFVFTGKKGQKAESLNSVFIARASGTFILFLFALIGSFFFKIKEIPHLTVYLLIAIFLIILLLVLIKWVPFEGMKIWDRSTVFKNARKFLVNLRENLKSGLLMPVTGLSLLLQIVSVVPYFLIFKAMGVTSGIFKVLILVPVITFSTMIVPTINGMGTREFLLSRLFHLELPTREIVGTFAAIFYSILIVLLLIGFVFWIQSLIEKRKT
jgi:glycosyltransferase 2 family protein